MKEISTLLSSLKTTDSKTFFLVRLDSNYCLLSRESESSLNELFRLALKAYNYPDSSFDVLIIQDGHSNQHSLSTNFGSEEDLLVDEIKIRIYKLRFICRVILKGNANWLYACSGRCLSTFAEIASACDGFISFSVNLEFGFPELIDGFFPVAGAFEKYCRKSTKYLESWVSEPVKILEEPIDSGPSSFVSARDWQSAAKSIMSNKSFKAKNRFKYPDVLLENYLDQLKVLPKAEFSYEADNHVDSALLLIKKMKDPRERARRMIESFCQFIGPQIISSRDSLSFSRTDLQAKFIQIELSSEFPNVDFVWRILSRKWNILFYSSHSQILKSFFEKIFFELEGRKFEKFHQIWGERVSGCVRSKAIEGVPVISNEGIDHFILRAEGEKWIFTVLPSVVPTIICETDDEYPISLLSNFGANVISFEGANIVACFVRNWMLEELYRVGVATGIGLSKTIEYLMKSGWGDHNYKLSWKMHIATRGSKLKAQLGSIKLNQEILKIDSWRELKRIGFERDSRIPTMQTVSIAKHFDVFSKLVSQALSSQVNESSRIQFKTLVDTLLGSPSFPRANSEVSERRSRHQIRHNWHDI